MDAQELRNLQEAYMEVVEGREGGRFEYNQRHGRPLITPEVSQSRSSQETLGGGTYEKGSKRLPKSKRKYDRQVLSGVRAASDQEKQRARERMGIGEDYDIDEAYVDFTKDRKDSLGRPKLSPRGKALTKAMSSLQPNPMVRHRDDEKNQERSKKIKTSINSFDSEKVQAKSAANKERGENKKRAFGNRLTRSDRQGIHDSYDIYDIILSHLLDEGYAETQEAAEAIMVSMSEEWREGIVEATAMVKRGYDEAPIRNRIAASTGGGEAADRATKLANRPTYGDEKTSNARQRLARSQRGDFRNTTSSSPGLHGYGHQSNDPAIKVKQAARAAQRSALTPNEKKQPGR